MGAFSCLSFRLSNTLRLTNYKSPILLAKTKIVHRIFVSIHTYMIVHTQRNRYPETGCNGAPSLSIKTDFHVNFTETFSDGIRVFMNGNRRTLPHGTASSTIIDAMVT